MRTRVEKILYALIVIFTIWAIVTSLMGKYDVLGSGGIKCFCYFTTDSNILLGISSLLCFVFSLTGRKFGPLEVLRLAATVSVSITFLVALLFLAPTHLLLDNDPGRALGLFTGNALVLHLINPILGVTTFLLSKQEKEIAVKDILWAITPVVVYSLVYLTLVVFVGVWYDWYGFTFGGHYWMSPIIMIFLYSAAALVAILLRSVKKKVG